MNKSTSVKDRTAVDIFHFALCAAGFFFAVGGVVTESVFVAVCGVGAIAWGLLYFRVTRG